MVSAAATIQATKNQPGLPIVRDMSAATIKTPEPIMAPATIIVESKNPSSRFGFRLSSGAGSRAEWSRVAMRHDAKWFFYPVLLLGEGRGL